jgi:hypothetical protein
MKRSFNKIFFSLAALSLMTSVFITGCRKEDEENPSATCNGSPAISAVTTPTNRAADIKGAKLDDWIILKGTNLCSISKITINNIEVSIKEAYVTGNEITFKIPKEVPKEVNNQIIVSGSDGQAKVDFTVYMAPLLLYGYGGPTEEFTPAGQNLIIKAKNLDLYGFTQANTTVKFGSVEAKPTKLTAEEIHVVVPANLGENTAVVVSNGATTQEVAVKYKDMRHVIYSMDNGISSWTGIGVVNGPTPAPIDRNYAVAAGAYAGEWSWSETFHFANNQPLKNYGITAGDVKRYLVKFEINVPKDWTSNPLRIWYRPTQGTWNYNFPWGADASSGAAFKTSGWQTVTIPLSDFIFSEGDSGDKKGTKVKELLESDLADYKEVRIFIQGPDKKEMTVYWDNFRIVPVPVLE